MTPVFLGKFFPNSYRLRTISKEVWLKICLCFLILYANLKNLIKIKIINVKSKCFHCWSTGCKSLRYNFFLYSCRVILLDINSSMMASMKTFFFDLMLGIFSWLRAFICVSECISVSMSITLKMSGWVLNSLLNLEWNNSQLFVVKEWEDEHSTHVSGGKRLYY